MRTDGSGLSLRKRLTWYVVVTLLLMTASSGVAIYQGTSHEADEVFSASLVQTARILDGLISRTAIETNRRQLKRALERGPKAHEYERKLFFAVLDENGKMLLHSREAPKFPRKNIETGFSEIKYKGKKWFTFAHGSSHDDLLIIVGERSGIREELTEYIGGGLLYPLIFLLPLVLWLLWQIVGVALKPLQVVTDQLLQQDLKHLKSIDVAGVPKEISPLVDALNQMIGDLDAAYLRERHFVSDASHELRNPLASLLINVDNAIEESSDTGAIESLQSMKLSIMRLTHLVSQLLALSHFENPDIDREFEWVDLGQVCAGVVESRQARAAAKSITLEMKISATQCRIKGSESLLESLLSNLVDNAILYCPRASRVRIYCDREDNDLVLAVDDSGPGLDAAQREKAAGRFYRAADTKASTNGAGLGLSIVETITASHSGRMLLSESELGGLRVSIRFDMT
ncbi:MAG: GHKL domain-containing protein [Gammaproteobacteria bacterium]|nr:GHKL domain-containing protein [Gammaproteobacteria bacterium]